MSQQNNVCHCGSLFQFLVHAIDQPHRAHVLDELLPPPEQRQAFADHVTALMIEESQRREDPIAFMTQVNSLILIVGQMQVAAATRENQRQ